MPRHFSRRVGAFRVRPVPDGADGCRDTGSGSGVRGRRERRCRRKARFAGRKKALAADRGRRAGRLPEKRIGRSRRAPGYRRRFRGAGAEESGGADGRHDSQAGKQALAVDRGRRAGRLPEKRIGRNRRAPGYRKRFGGAGAEEGGGAGGRHDSRAAGPGGFRKSEPDGTDGRRDTGGGSGVPGQKKKVSEKDRQTSGCAAAPA